MNRRSLGWGLLGWGLTDPLKSQALAQETIIWVRPIQDRGYQLYGLDARVNGLASTLILDTGSHETWVDTNQTAFLSTGLSPRRQVEYVDGSQVKGETAQAILNLGTWQQSLPLVAARTLEGPPASAAQTVRRSLAQGVLGLAPGTLPGVRRFSLQLGGKRPALTLNPTFYPSSITLPYAGRKARVFLGQDPPIQTLLDSGSSFILMRPSVAAQLGVGAGDLAPFSLPVRPDVTLAMVTRTVKFRLGKLRLRFDPPRILVVQSAPSEILSGLDLVLGIPFFEQVLVTWDLHQQVVHVGENP